MLKRWLLQRLKHDAQQFTRNEIDTVEFRARVVARIEMAHEEELDFFAERLAGIRIGKEKEE